jgi:hypothetical protein
MGRTIFVIFCLILVAGLLSACGTTISQQDLTKARQAAYDGGYSQGYSQGLAEGNNSGYNKGYSEGYVAAANAILAVWPPGYTAPVVSPPVISAK